MEAWYRAAATSLCVGLAACAGPDARTPGDPADAEPGAADRVAVALAEPPSAAGAVHIVRMVARGDQYAFEPAELTIRPGEVVRFMHTAHQPESVVFDPGNASAEAAAFIHEHVLTHGPLLTEPGAIFDVEFHDAPAGEYPFHSFSHRDRGMEGRIVVEGG